MVDANERVRVLVLGDSGVGKTSLVQVIAQIKNTQPSWTIGCNVEPVLYERTGEFLELWDVGGSTVHEGCRSVFMRGQYHGLILVHDLTNSKSYSNMWKWALEYGRKGEPAGRCNREQEMGVVRGIDVPVLIVGTKQDQLWSRSRYLTDRTGIVADTNAQMISVNCTDDKQFDNRTYQQQQLHEFFDKVLQSKKQPSSRPRNRVNTGNTSYLDLGL